MRTGLVVGFRLVSRGSSRRNASAREMAQTVRLKRSILAGLLNRSRVRQIYSLSSRRTVGHNLYHLPLHRPHA